MPDVDKIRNIGLLSHSGAGKTSLMEALLFKCGATERMGSIAEGNTVGDYDEQEKERKVSIGSSLANVTWRDVKINFIDCPGYADFVGEVISALCAIDTAVILVNAQNGVEVNTQKYWDMADEKKAAKAVFINKLDKENTDFSSCLEQVREAFGNTCVAVQCPGGKESGFKSCVDLVSMEGAEGAEAPFNALAKELRGKLVECVVETDDALLEKYLEGGEVSGGELKAALRNAVASRKITPVLCGCAMNPDTLTGFLNAVVDYFPSPAQVAAPEVTADSGGKKTVTVGADGAFLGRVFKTISDPYVGQLTMFKVISGKLASNTGFFNASKGQRERIGQITFMKGKEQLPAESVSAGDIASVAKLKSTSTGDTICDEKQKVFFETIKFPTTSISFSIKPKTRSDEDKISEALGKLTSEDRTFTSGRDAQTKELIIGGMGDLHLEIMVSKLRKKFGVDVEIGTPKVPYKETVRKTAQSQGKYKRQSGGRGQYGDCWLEISPQERGAGFVFEDRIVGGSIPRQYVPAVEKGVVEAMEGGVLAGYPVVDIIVGVFDGSYHDVDSSEMAFKIAASMGFKKCFEQANPVILEPIMNVEITVPEECMGDITGNINSRRGRIVGIEPKGRNQVVKATIPLAEMFKYATELRSMTGGRGSYQMQPSHYEEVPLKIQEQIITKSKAEKEK